jgi:hypothetical protein
MDNTPTTYQPAAEPPQVTHHEPAEQEPTEGATRKRRPRTNLEGDLKKILDGIVMGTVTLDEGQQPTPHVLARLISLRLRDGDTVSAGAVTAALERWEKVGFIRMERGPKRFGEYTHAGQTEGLSALKAKSRAERAAAKSAESEDAPF